MATHIGGPSALDTILPRLHRTESDPRTVVVMTCGIAGAGKSTLSKGIVNSLPSFTRLSVDVIIHEKHGLFAIDYPAEKYAEYQDEAKAHLQAELVRLLREKQRDVVLDLSFWNRAFRDEYKAMVENNGGRWVLVLLDAGKEVLRRRIAERRAQRDSLALGDEGRDGDSAYDVDEETFERFCGGFEKPLGEGEIVIKVV